MFRMLNVRWFVLALAWNLVPGCMFAQGVPAEALTAPLTKAPQSEVPLADSPFAPKAIILGYSLSSEVDTSTFRHGDGVTLSAGWPDIIVFFNSSPASTTGTQFRYRLADYTTEWTITDNRMVHFRRLTPGHYRFEIQARKLGQPWGATVATLAIYQQPFFYQTWYFYLLLLLGAIGLAMQLLHQRDQLLKGQMGMVLEERNRIASDCHDTLMAGFAAISWQLEATAKLFPESDPKFTPAAQSCELARSMVAHCQSEARRIIWNLRDLHEPTNILSHALSHAITAHRFHDSIETSFHLEGEEIPITPGAVHHLVCIGQEAMTNSIRHARSSKIDIGLRYENDSLSLSIRDNGRGFQLSDLVARSGHFGIAVMEERARKLGGTLRLTTPEGGGTEVAITVSFHIVDLPAGRQHHIVPWIGV